MRHLFNQSLKLGRFSTAALVIGSLALGVMLPASADAHQGSHPHKTHANSAQTKTGKAVRTASAKPSKAVKTSSPAKVTKAAKPRSVAKASSSKKVAAKSVRPAVRQVSGKNAKPVRTHAAVRATKPVAAVRAADGSREVTAAARNLALQSRAALVMDADTGEILYGKNQAERVSIASITKLMTSMVVLDAGQDMNEMLTITNDDVDRVKHSSSRLNVGSRLSRHDMMLLALMSSENRAASALARNYPGGTTEAVKAMNRKAAALGMGNSQFADGTGLNPGNQASLTDLAKMVKAAAGYDTIHRLSTTEQHFAPVKGYKSLLKYQNSNPLVKNDQWDIGVTKTGYIKEAGHCLVMEARIAQRNTILVLMDSWGKYTRVGDAARVRQWVEGTRLASQ